MPDPQTISNGVLAVILIATTLGAKLTTDGRKKRRQARKLRNQVEELTEVVYAQRKMLLNLGVKKKDLPAVPNDPFEYDEDEEEPPSPPRNLRSTTGQ